MKTAIQTFVVILVLLFISFNEISAWDDLNEVRKRIEQLNLTENRALMELDLDTILDMCADDVVVMPIFKPMKIGKAALRRDWEREASKGLKINSATSSIVEIWRSENRVYERGTFGLSVGNNEVPIPVAYYGSYFSVWEIQSDGKYKLKYRIENLDHNPFGGNN